MVKTTRKKGVVPPVISELTIARISLHAQGIKDVQSAINSARNELLPRRKLLYELYENLVLDPHLQAVLAKRAAMVLNKRIVWRQHGASEEQTRRVDQDVINTPWFYSFLEATTTAGPWGTTLIELVPGEGKVVDAVVVPRANVLPEHGYIVRDAANIQEPWIYYRTDPTLRRYLIEVGRPKDLGALVVALPYLVFKRGGFGDWAQFVELFGMPFRTGKYNPYDSDTRQQLNKALSEMGGAGYAVIPDGTSIEFHQSSGTSQSTAHKDMVAAINDELSKLFLGNTLTTAQGDRGARSLGDVHMEAEDELAFMDMRRTRHLLNYELRPRLVELGYPLGDGEFDFDDGDVLPLEKRIAIDVLVAQQVQVPDRYWYETYSIPEPSAAEKRAAEEQRKETREQMKSKGQEDEEEEEEEEDEGSKKKP